MSHMLSLEDYKTIRARTLRGLSDAEIKARYEADTMLMNFVLLAWFRHRKTIKKEHDRIDS